MSDLKIYESQIRALLGPASSFCEVVRPCQPCLASQALPIVFCNSGITNHVLQVRPCQPCFASQALPIMVCKSGLANHVFSAADVSTNPKSKTETRNHQLWQQCGGTAPHTSPTLSPNITTLTPTPQSHQLALLDGITTAARFGTNKPVRAGFWPWLEPFFDERIENH